MSMQNEKLETVQDYHQKVRNSSVSQNEVAVACHHLEHFQVVADFKSQIARLEMEKEDLERELSKKISADHGVQLALQFNGKDQVVDDFPRTASKSDCHFC